MSKKEISILVVVHPGSACGSADFNLRDNGIARDKLIKALKDWKNGVVVLDSEFSDELPYFPELNSSIKAAISQATGKGLVAERIMAEDPEQSEAIVGFIRKLKAQKINPIFTVTGAWYHPDDGSGCVGSVIDAIKSEDCIATLHDSALRLFEPEDEIEQLTNQSSKNRPGKLS